MTQSSEKTKPVIAADRDSSYWQPAQQLSEQLLLPLIPLADGAFTGEGLALTVGAQGVSLTDGSLTLQADFTQNLGRIHRLGQELLVKAARVKGAEHPLLIDATAGLGEDSLLLAAAGFRVQLYEYDPVIAALLADGLRRAAAHPQLAPIVGRMQLFAQDSTAVLPHLAVRPDVILLDPMFPGRQKSALVKKKFQLLQQLESPCSGEQELLNAALAARPKKIIIKRPVKGPYLAGVKPSHSYTGKAVRIDCIVPPPPGEQIYNRGQ